MISINKLSYSYIQDIKVIDSISFEVVKNRPIAILCPSGCGKSTLLRCISGYLTPDSGDVNIDGNNTEHARLNKDFGFAFQDPALLSWKNIEENITLPNRLGKIETFKDDIEIRERLDFLLTLTGLKDYQYFYPNQLSGGMKQRVSLARALFTKPRLLLLDEPFASLDLLTRTSLAFNLQKMISETEIPTILVTHSIEEAIIFAKRIYVLSHLPANIKETIDIDTDVNDLKSIESTSFLKIVSQCRSLLLNERNL